MPKNPFHVGNSLQTVPLPPDSLSEGARREWTTIAPVIFELHTGRPADLRTLELLCEILADIRSLEGAIRADGYTIQGGSGGAKANPALRNLEASRRQAQMLLDRFGLMPDGRKISDYF